MSRKALELFSKKVKKNFNSSSYGVKNLSKPIRASHLTGVVGLEIEMEGHRLPATIPVPDASSFHWDTHEDGSLRHPNGADRGGKEYVLREPIPSELVPEAVNTLYNTFEANRSELIPSRRTSTHVHLNFCNARLDQLAAMVSLWGTFEEVLVNYCGDSRPGNLFCLRLQDAEYAVTLWENAFQKGIFQFPEEYRYLALNCAAFTKFGSFEIRTLEGTTQPERIIEWVELLVRLREVALKREFLPLPHDLSMKVSGASGKELFREVFQGCAAVEKVIEENDRLGVDFNRAVRNGFRRVQPIAFSLPWHEIIDDLKKVFIPDPFGSSDKKKEPLQWGIAAADRPFEQIIEDTRRAAARTREMPNLLRGDNF